MTFRTFYAKNHLKKKHTHQKSRILTCIYIALKSIQVDSKIVLANISGKNFCVMMSLLSMATTLP